MQDCTHKPGFPGKKKSKIAIILFQMLTWQCIIDQFQVFKEIKGHSAFFSFVKNMFYFLEFILKPSGNISKRNNVKNDFISVELLGELF